MLSNCWHLSRQTFGGLERLACAMIRFPALLCVLPLLGLGCAQTEAQTPPVTPRAPLAQLGAASALQTQFDERGLVRLSYNGQTLTDVNANGGEAFSVGDVHFLGADGTLAKRNAGEARRAWDEKSKTLTLAYDWGRVSCRYQTLNDRLNLDITVTNEGQGAFAGVNLFPLVVKFQGFPRGFDANTPHVNFNLDGPTVQSADFGAGELTVVNRQVEKPLSVGFTTTSETGRTFRYNIYVGSAPLWYQPNNWPRFTRPIAPGASDTYQISLRFAPKGDAMDNASSGADIYRAFAAAHPMTLDWPDRRPIGALFLSSAADNHPADNPRGWFNNAADVDVTTGAGRARFRERLMNYAAQSIAQLRAVGAQGMITWDVEGQQHPHPTSYIGDPRLLAQLTPEMDALADEYFRVFREAGFKVGICVRPQQLEFGADGRPRQKNVADEAATLNQKIAYARKRWGATLFYVDSNGGPYDPSDAEVFRQVAADNPDVLLMPEHQNFKYQAYTAPYNDLRFESSVTPGAVRSTYPRAFSVMKGEAAQLTKRRAELVRAVRNGDILMWNAWYSNDEAPLIKSIYDEASR